MTDATTAGMTTDYEISTTRRWRRVVLYRIVLGAVAALLLCWLVLYITKGRFLRHPFERLVGGLTHRSVTVRGDFQLYFAPFQLKLVADGLAIGNPAWATKPMLFTADRLDARIAPLSLIFGRRRLYALTMDKGAVDLEWNAAHTTNSWTFSEKKGGAPLEFPTIDRAVVSGTTLRYRDPRMRLLADIAFDTVRSADTRIGRSVSFDGKGVVRDTPFTVTGALLSPDETVARGRNRLKLRAVAANNVIGVAGVLPSVADIEGVPLAVAARGRNVDELLGIIGVVVPETRAYRMTAQLVKKGDEYRFRRLIGRFGDSDIAGRFTVNNGGPRVHIAATLATRTLDIVDVAPFIGYNPDIVATRGFQAAARATGAPPALMLPDAPLRVAAMRQFDADVRYTVDKVRSRKIPLSDIALTLALKNGVMTLSPLTLSMARGNIAADVTVDTRKRPAHTSYDIRLAPTPMGRLLAGFGVTEAGTTGLIKGRAQLEGDGDTIHDSLSTADGRIAATMPRGTLSTGNVQLAELDIGTFAQKMFQGRLKEPVQINCGLIGFTVRNGIAAADPILIDTAKSVITGRGGFSFRTERMDLAFRADGKKFSLLSGQSPVGLGGYFSRPSLSVISPQLLSRAGVGLGLGLLATPPAAILAFVDVGDAKAAACGPVLAGARAKAQRTDEGDARSDVGNGTTSKAPKKKKFLGLF
ncbi:AsmA family protein [Sphingomonas sp. Leaf17]|uniref:AsmA family protein n=1 Tax=Sphingomonas sp. Leaf17 TaxID=1735683 RepID=UPI0007019AE0|nr:AsmA family protein [Sphingomonas sp. Leaf17]KQM68129.1 AsmA family protein [Sphingomonas sp. Leaf17]